LLKQPFAIRVLTWFAALESAGMYLSILLAVLDIGPHMMGRERVTRDEWLHIAAPLVAVIGILMACTLVTDSRLKGIGRVTLSLRCSF